MTDENLYSRQLYVLGHDAMKKMAQSNILIVGLNSLGVEVAKNIILSGVLSVTLHDTENTSYKDLSGQYYLSEKDVGKNRAESCLNKLQELNSNVLVNYATNDLTKNYLLNFSVVVFCSTQNYNYLIKINNICRDEGIKFIYGQSLGLCGLVFTDFGKKFIVNDLDGEPIKSSLIDKIVQDNGKIIISCIDTKPHDLQINNYVKFNNSLKNNYYKVNKIIDRFTFVLESDEKIDLEQNCMFEQVKMPDTISFKSFEESLKEPEFMYYDLANFEKPEILHKCFQLLDKFIEENNRFPAPYCESDYNLFVNNEECSTDLIKQFCYTCSGNLCPTSAVIGGIIGQEVMKACSGKFTPIKQFLYFGAFECLGKDWKNINKQHFTLDKHRYIGQTIIFGDKFQEQLGNKKWFIVGAGAIGCELLKNFAMGGLCCGDNGQLFITDMDCIEKSNLNRQFLFRNKHIGQLKSEIAAIQIKGMNKDINIIPHQNKVGLDTENIYDDDFFNSLDGVANALDNIQARLYMDEKCIYYGKPLLESGTLGTKGNVQVIVPNITESYGSTRDPPEKSVPVCTLKHFPNQIEHTIQYARDQFEGLFTTVPEKLKQYIEIPNYLNDIKKKSPQDYYSVLNDLHDICKFIPKDFSDCIKWIRLLFESHYNNQIQQLLHNFPKNHKTENGSLFWSSGRMCPKPIQFDINNNLHMNYIISGSNLVANLFDIDNCFDKIDLINILKKMQIPKFTPKDNIKISVNDSELKENENNFELNNDLPELKINVYPIQFEKDDDTNFHMDFITSASNLRAINYGIQPINKHETKRIAGKIIPAIATSTAIVAGLVTFELYKLCQGLTDIESYRDTFINLAIPLMTTTEPKPCKIEKYSSKEFTLWDFIEIEGNITLEELINICEQKYGFEIDILTYGNYNNSLLYAFYQPPLKIADKMNMTIGKIIKNISNEDISNKKSIILNVVSHHPDDPDEDMIVPPIKIKLID
jgi:ubiquitin-activating enzyme E1